MKDDPILSRNDVIAPPSENRSLPPTQKLAKDVWGDIFLLIVLVIALTAAKWGIIPGDSFDKALIGVLFIKATSLVGKGVSLDALPFIRR